MGLFKKHRCGLCASRFSRQEELMHHMQSVHCKDSPYDCRECARSFSSMEEMRAHLQREHSYKKDR